MAVPAAFAPVTADAVPPSTLLPLALLPSALLPLAFRAGSAACGLAPRVGPASCVAVAAVFAAGRTGSTSGAAARRPDTSPSQAARRVAAWLASVPPARNAVIAPSANRARSARSRTRRLKAAYQASGSFRTNRPPTPAASDPWYTGMSEAGRPAPSPRSPAP